MTAPALIPVPIRDAATVILTRQGAGDGDSPEVLMGQRGAKAAFMPSKFVFPGGAVDPGDAAVPLAELPDPVCMSRLTDGLAPETAPAHAQALVAAAIRETWEETGLVLGRPGHWPDPPADWAGFANRGIVPSGAGLRFVFRAITPPGRPRRFDARFFLADVSALGSDAEDFSEACDELSGLQWIPLAKVRGFDLPFITQVVLAEVAQLIRRGGVAPETVPFFYNDDEASLFQRLGGQVPIW